nr:MAG TPA: hypothetical protein [Caudoviricetes sp.]
MLDDSVKCSYEKIVYFVLLIYLSYCPVQTGQKNKKSFLDEILANHNLFTPPYLIIF